MNLTEVVVREDDTVETLKEKVRIATILGTYQATLTDFPYLRKIWKDNTEEERLLGVSLTGIMDNSMMVSVGVGEILEELKQVAIDVNKEVAEALGIQQSTAITCIKPSGTVSQLVDSASGIHPRFSDFYIRTVRADNKDPLTQLMKDQGVYNEPDVMNPNNTTVFFFPKKSPEDCVKVADLTAMQQLEIWKEYQDSWCEHKPSITVYVREHEWMEVGAWVYKNFDSVSGISFLPYSDHIYKQAPYMPISEEEYLKMVSEFPTLDFSKLSEYEAQDMTVGVQALACSGDSCELVDLT